MSDYAYGTKSIGKLDTCHPALKKIAIRALELSPYDITIIHGWRGEEVQNALFDSRASTKRWPDSKHNNLDTLAEPASLAIDFAPWINGTVYWGDTHIFAIVAGCFMAAAADLGYTLRWGGDWDGDGVSKGDQKLMDYGHVELVV